MPQPTNAEAMVKLWHESGTGIGIYVRLPNGNEPVYMGGMVEKFASSSTIDIAIRWLTQLSRAARLSSLGTTYQGACLMSVNWNVMSLAIEYFT